MATRAAARSPRRRHPGVVIRRRFRGAFHGRRRAHRLRPMRGHGHDQTHRPVLGAGDRMRHGITAVGAFTARHLHEATEDRPRRRARAEASQLRKLRRRRAPAPPRAPPPRRAPRSRTPTRPAGGGRHAVFADDPGRAPRCRRAPEPESRKRRYARRRRRGQPARRRGRRGRRRRPRTPPSSASRARSSVSDRLSGGGKVEGDVALAPVLHQRDVRAGHGGDGAGAHNRPRGAEAADIPAVDEAAISATKPAYPAAFQRARTSRS